MALALLWLEVKISTRVESKLPQLINKTFSKFGDDRFRDLASAEGQILPFPIDFDGRPCNTFTLPYERVMLFSNNRLNQRCRAYKITLGISVFRKCNNRFNHLITSTSKSLYPMTMLWTVKSRLSITGCGCA